MQFDPSLTRRALLPDFQREVHSLFGLPFDALTQDEAVQRVREAARTGERLFLSTPNMNFAAACETDAAFRQTVLTSQLSTADGASIVLLARLMGVPLPERVTGAGVFERLRTTAGHRVKVYFFGGLDGAAEQAVNRLAADDSPGVQPVGFQSPGTVPCEQMSGPAFTDPINDSGAEFVVVALGARKGQQWIGRNWSSLNAPVISHLGAVVNFAAGTIRRAPQWLQALGLEWLWRIKEEPGLWRRYWSDGRIFARYLLRGALPWALYNRREPVGAPLRCQVRDTPEGVLIELAGAATNGGALAPLRSVLADVCARGKPVTVDLQAVTYVGSGFIGLMQLLEGWLRSATPHGSRALLRNVPPSIERVFQWAGVGYMLPPPSAATSSAAASKRAEPRIRLD